MRDKIPTSIIVGLYLTAIVLANLSIILWGQWAMILIAWVLIPFDFVARDILHGRWGEGRTLWFRIFLLILGGGTITTIINIDALRICAASVTAFSIGVIINTVMYSAMRDTPREKRMNISNSTVALIDSIAFPLLALGTLSPMLSLIQFLSKAGGSLLWARLLVGKLNIK